MTLKEKLTNDIYHWVAGGGKVPSEKEKVFKMMIQATLDFLYLKGYLKGEKKNEKPN